MSHPQRNRSVDISLGTLNHPGPEVRRLPRRHRPLPPPTARVELGQIWSQKDPQHVQRGDVARRSALEGHCNPE
jgi:hypothetical protein